MGSTPKRTRILAKDCERNISMMRKLGYQISCKGMKI